MGRVFQLDFDALRGGVTERIYQCFPTDSVNLIANQGVKRAGLAFDDDAEPDFVVQAKLVGNRRKCLLEIHRAALIQAQPSNCVPALVSNLPHQLENTVQCRFCLLFSG
jgi:hypothetical protein